MDRPRPKPPRPISRHGPEGYRHVTNPLTQTIVDFLTGIGVEVVPTELESGGLLPGIRVDCGRLLVDESKLTYPGDLLHEAGHIAVAPPEVRGIMSADVAIPGADPGAVEVLATAWAYAAVVHLGLDPAVLFHDGGYRGRSAGLILTYTSGVYPGVHGLQQLGMTTEYPRMQRWLRA